ncbi:MAG: HD domain-containing protein [Clostridia bacterium]|nr:HD domain-containing protein [Clostridia bacterium]
MMEKMLVVDNTNINNLILHEIFDSKYEIIETDSSEIAFKFINEYKDEIKVIIIMESIAADFTDDMLKTLKDSDVLEYIPVIMIIDNNYLNGKTKVKNFPYSDVINSPVNPYIIKTRVSNLTELFSNKKELESTVQSQTEKIISQDNLLKKQERKMNTDDMLEILGEIVNYRDVESGNHLLRIRKYTEILLRILAEKYPKYDITEDKITLITSAAALHDIGKIAIPDAILLNPRRLTSEEFNIMKQHTVQGCKMLDELDSVQHDECYIYCYQICRYHHEKYDGKGYPDGLVGDEIPICAQVVSVADCYDALTNERPYKPAFSHEQASEMIKTGACGAFSDEMMDCFESALPQFKELAEQYQNSDEVHNTSEKYIKTNENTRLKKIYSKMDKKDLIAVIERQKKNITDERKYCSKVLYSIADFVMEFDIRQDAMIECKGSITKVLGYMPKNYYEAVTVLSDLCSDECKQTFKDTFSMNNIYDAAKKGKKRISLECMMKTGKRNYSRVQFYAVPNLENGELVSIYCVALILKNRNEIKHHDSDETNHSFSLEKYSAMVKEEEKANLIDFEKRFVPVVNSKTGKIISYDFIEISKENSTKFSFDEMYESLYYTTNVTAFSLNSMKRIISSVYALEQEGINFPQISVMTMFGGLDTEKVIKAIGEIFLEFPINCHKICINITQDMLKTLNLKGLEKFIDSMRNYGFKVGVYNVGMNSINTKCFTQRLFDRVIFANEFLDNIDNGTYPLELVTYMIEYFSRLGTEVYMPMGVNEKLVERIEANTSVPFGIPQRELISFDTFRKDMRMATITPVYPILSHENTHPVLSEKMYDEILVQTKSFILELNINADMAVFSKSFETLYGYVPAQNEFVKSIRTSEFLHTDDINKFIKRINQPRNKDDDSEFFVRVYSHKTDSYLWNKMRLISERTSSGEAVKTVAICTDISDRQADVDFDILRNKRTAYITNLYRKHSAENIIKTFLDGEGANGSHALIIAEVKGFDTLEKTLGTAFANAVIKEFSVKIRELFCDFDIIGSHSGNQFLIFVKNTDDIQKLTEKSAQICSIINNKYNSDSDEITVSGKTGISLYSENGKSYAELYHNALDKLKAEN